jgi:hypothetical protein
MKKLTSLQIGNIRQDILTICQIFNHKRKYNNRYITAQGLDPKSATLDPYFLFEGGAELTKEFHNNWQLASKIAQRKGYLTAFTYINNSGLVLFDTEIEEVSKAFFWIPGQPIPNKWTGNRYSQDKSPETMLLSFGCNVDGTIKKIWASIVYLTANPDGKSGDWKFNADGKNSGFSSLDLTQDITGRPSYQQIVGNIDIAYKSTGDAKRGLQLMLENLPLPPVDMEASEITVNIGLGNGVTVS